MNDIEIRCDNINDLMKFYKSKIEEITEKELKEEEIYKIAFYSTGYVDCNEKRKEILKNVNAK